MDDKMIWDTTVEENFVLVCKLLDIYGKAGMVGDELGQIPVRTGNCEFRWHGYHQGCIQACSRVL